jgi:hypothetical protein
MKTPRYTDNRYPNGYRKSVNTSVAATFKRIRAEQKAKAEQDAANAAEASKKTIPLPRKVSHG